MSIIVTKPHFSSEKHPGCLARYLPHLDLRRYMRTIELVRRVRNQFRDLKN